LQGNLSQTVENLQIRLLQRARSTNPINRFGIVHGGRIKPGNPRQNGRHGRMHLTLKRETTKPAACNFLQQLAKRGRIRR
jgi:hypothetical protein